MHCLLIASILLSKWLISDGSSCQQMRYLPINSWGGKSLVAATHLYFEEVGFIVQFPSQSLIFNTTLAFCLIVVDCITFPSLGRHGSEDVTRFGVKCGQFWSGTHCSPTQMKREAFDVTNWDLWSDFLSRDKGEQANSDDEFHGCVEKLWLLKTFEIELCRSKHLFQIEDQMRMRSHVFRNIWNIQHKFLTFCKISMH